jgi:tellurite resistance protein
MADEMSRAFQRTAIPQPGFLDRLRGRVPRAAVVVEIRNILATTKFDEIRESDVADVLAKAKLLPRDALAELSAIFEDAALALTTDREMSDADSHALDVLKRAFELSDADAQGAIERAVSTVYERALHTAMAGDFTADDKARLDQIATALRLRRERATELYSSAAHAVLQAALNAALADHRYSTSDEEHLEKLANALGAKLQFDPKTTEMLTRLRLLGEVEKGRLPSCDVAILLQRGEICHHAIMGVAHKELRTVTKRINYGGPTASIKIMKGLRWRMGSLAVQRVTQDVMTEVDRVDVFITSKKVFLKGLRKNTSIPLGKVIHFTVYSDGLQLEKESGKDVYLVGSGDWELAGACLDAASRKAHA